MDEKQDTNLVQKSLCRTCRTAHRQSAARTHKDRCAASHRRKSRAPDNRDKAGTESQSGLAGTDRTARRQSPNCTGTRPIRRCLRRSGHSNNEDNAYDLETRVIDNNKLEILMYFWKKKCKNKSSYLTFASKKSCCAIFACHAFDCKINTY